MTHNDTDYMKINPINLIVFICILLGTYCMFIPYYSIDITQWSIIIYIKYLMCIFFLWWGYVSVKDLYNYYLDKRYNKRRFIRDYPIPSSFFKKILESFEFYKSYNRLHISYDIKQDEPQFTPGLFVAQRITFTDLSYSALIGLDITDLNERAQLLNWHPEFLKKFEFAVNNFIFHSSIENILILYYGEGVIDRIFELQDIVDDRGYMMDDYLQDYIEGNAQPLIDAFEDIIQLCKSYENYEYESKELEKC